MKKCVSFFLCFMILWALTSCGDYSSSDMNEKPSAEANDALKEEIVNEDEDISSGEIDVDLTTLSGTMVYAEVYNMMISPKNYIGKTVKMNGTFTAYYDEDSGNYYFSCIIMDATACCSQGIEFILTDDYIYPDDYPEEGDTICVVGVFDTYKEGDYTYCTLRNARYFTTFGKISSGHVIFTINIEYALKLVFNCSMIHSLVIT